MSIRNAFLGPRSKYDKSLPYTYVAKIPAIEGDEELYNDYFADTICGLIEYLDEHEIEPGDVRLYGCYLKEEIPLDTAYCLSEDGKWLKPPDICHSLEEHYRESMDLAYKGHVEHGDCSYEDRDRAGSGPY